MPKQPAKVEKLTLRQQADGLRELSNTQAQRLVQVSNRISDVESEISGLRQRIEELERGAGTADEVIVGPRILEPFHSATREVRDAVAAFDAAPVRELRERRLAVMQAAIRLGRLLNAQS